VSLVTDKGLFWSSFPTFILWLTNGQCLSMEPIWVVSDMKENLYRGPQFTFFPFYRKGNIWSMVL
jgi:hypothetical protein